MFKQYDITKFNSVVKVIEYLPSENPSQVVKSPTGKRQAQEKFTHAWYLARGYKVKATVNFSYFNMDTAGESLFNGVLIRDGGKPEGTPGNGHVMWLDKAGKMHVKLLNTLGVGGIPADAVCGGSLAYSLILNGKIDLQHTAGFNVDGKVERTFIGQKADLTIKLYAGKALTGRECAQVAYDDGCIVAIMGDGGGSTEMIVDGKEVFAATRPKGTVWMVFEKIAVPVKPPTTVIVKPTNVYRVAHIKTRANTRYKAGTIVKKKYLTIHTTNNYKSGANAEMHRKFLETTDGYVSFALVVDIKETIELMPLNEPAFSAGDGRDGEHNVFSISMEICCDVLDVEGKLDPRCYANAVETAAKIIVEKKVVMDQHRDVPERTWKNCPNAWILNYKQFVIDVNKRVADLTKKPVVVVAPSTPKKLYRVQVGAFSNLANAENLMKELKSKGYATLLKEEVK